MAVISAIFWILGFALSVVIAPQLRMWTWGPTMLCFGASVLFALPGLLGKGSGRDSFYVLIPGVAVAGWIALRAAFSPVAELAMQDLLLVCMAVTTFAVFKVVGEGAISGKLLITGVALVLGACLWVIGRQLTDPYYSPVFPAGKVKFIRGFFGHYGYCASFLVPSSLLLAGLALYGRLHGVARVILLAVAVSGMVAVVLTKSRGGVIGVGIGTIVLALGCVLIGKRDGKRWFVPTAIIAPIVLIGVTVFILGVLEDVQSKRGGGDLSGMLDNTIRFYLLGIAMSCISMHPWTGGGSRSFSWECFQAWDVNAYGAGLMKPEHVHNEFVQTVTDYGIIGGLLLLVFLGCIVFVSLTGLCIKGRQSGSRPSDGWRLGGLAGLAGLFMHSQFEGILRIPPGAILLGLCLATASTLTPRPVQGGELRLGSWLLALCALAAAIPLSIFGWKGTLATKALWPAYFSRIPLGTETRLDALSKGIAIWPMNDLLQRRAALYRTLATEEDIDDDSKSEMLELAASDFRRAAELHPYDPTTLLNHAVTLSLLGRDGEVAPLYRRAVEAQGNMEAGFNANHHYARYLLVRGIAEYNCGETSAALDTLQIAARHIDKALELTGGWSLGNSGFELSVGIRSSLGQVLEAAGDARGAMEQYDFAASLRNGGSANYLAGLLLMNRGVTAWSERRSEDALRLFMEAENRIARGNPLPAGATAEDRNEYLEYLRRTIRYLEGAKVEPSQKLDF